MKLKFAAGAVGFCALLLALGAGARAAESAQASGEAGEKSIAIEGPDSETWTTVRDHTDVSYYGVYYGPSFGNMDARISDGYGRQTKTNQYFLNYLNLGYKPQADISAGVTVLSTYSPVMGQGLTALDPYLRLTDKKLVHTQNFNLYSELRFFLPITNDTHNLHKLVTPGTFQAVSYHIPGTRFTLGSWAKLYYSFWDSQAKVGDDWQAYLKPQVFYSISSKVTAAVYYEMQANHAINQSLGNWHSVLTDLQLGAMWDILPRVDINPYVQVATGSRVGVDTTAVGAQIFVTML